MRLERIWAQQEKDRQVAEALAKFAAMQTGLKSEKAGKTAVNTSSGEGKQEDVTKRVAGENKIVSDRIKMEPGRTESKKQAAPVPQGVNKAVRPTVGKKTLKTGPMARNRPVVKAN